MLAQNCTNGRICKEPATRRLSRMLNQAATNTSSELYQALEIVNKGLVHINRTNVPIVDLVMVPGLESNLTELEFTWKCVDFHPDYLDFVLNFAYV